MGIIFPRKGTHNNNNHNNDNVVVGGGWWCPVLLCRVRLRSYAAPAPPEPLHNTAYHALAPHQPRYAFGNGNYRKHTQSLSIAVNPLH
jgi:hypothetical protein